MSTGPLRARTMIGSEVLGLLVVVNFGAFAQRFPSAANFGSIAFQLPEVGLLTLPMLTLVISGGLNLAIITTANISGLTFAWVLNAQGGVEAGLGAFVLGSILALGVGSLAGCAMGIVIAFTGAHPILVSLSMMIFLRGLGKFATRGGDVSGFPDLVAPIGHGLVLGIPVPLLIFGAAVLAWHTLPRQTRHGFAVSLLLVTVLACFLGGVDPFGGFGRVWPVVLALVVLQVLSSGLSLLVANQHLSTAIWGLFLLGVLLIRFLAARWPSRPGRRRSSARTGS